MSDMRRREFITLLGAAAWPLVARAQQSVLKMPRIGVIDPLALREWDHFRQGLRDLGYIEGRDIVIEYRSAEARPEQLVAVATELAQLPVDIIVTFNSQTTQAAKQATTTIPIVMAGIGDPIRAGFVASLAHPGGNITGNTILGPEVAAKRLQLLKLAVPTMLRVAFLWNPDNPSHAAYPDEWKAAAQALGVEMLFVAVRSSNEFDSAFAAMMRQRPDAFTMTGDLLHQLHIGWIIDFLARNRLPGMYQFRENVIAGGLMSYGVSLPDVFRRAAGYVHKILQGARPADLPVEQPTKFELVVNLRTARGDATRHARGSARPRSDNRGPQCQH